MSTWFLDPVGLGDQSRSFTWSRDYSKRSIAPQNPTLKEDDFYFAAPDPPFLIAGAALERSHRISLSDKIQRIVLPQLAPDFLVAAFWPADITPLYAGVGVFDPAHRLLAMSRYTFFPEPEIGGGFIEPLGFDGQPRVRVQRIFDWINFRRESAFIAERSNPGGVRRSLSCRVPASTRQDSEIKPKPKTKN